MCDILLPGSEKLKYALEWKVPIVSSKWLWDGIHEGELKPFDPYLVRHPRNQPSIDDSKPSDDRTEALQAESHINPSTRTINGNRERLSLGSSLGWGKNEPGDQLIDSTSLRVVEDSPIKKREVCLDAVDAPAVQTETDNPNPIERHNSPLHPASSVSVPLKEISLNSSPKAPASPPKAHSPSSKPTTSVKITEVPLGPAISSLLAHHQRLAATNPATKPSEDLKLGRRRRQLLGRAPSSMSARSNGSLNISRASSVDTMNTDGLGTPLESSTARTREGADGDESFATLHGVAEKDPLRESVEQPLQMTQLGYEDPDVQAWRERVVKKLGGVGQIEPDAGKRVEGIGVVTDVGGRGAKSIGRRTRQASGR